MSTAQRGAAPPHRVPIGVCGGVPSSAPSACIGPAPNRITESLFTGLLFFLCAWWLLAPSPANLPPRRRSGQSHPPPQPPAHPISHNCFGVGEGGDAEEHLLPGEVHGGEEGGLRDAGDGHLPLQGNQGEGGSATDDLFQGQEDGPTELPALSSHLGEVKISRKWLQIGLTPPSRTPPNKVYYQPGSNPFKSPHGGQGWD